MKLEKLLSSEAYPQKAILEKLICHQLSLTKEDLFTQIEKEVSSVDLDRIDVGYHAYTVEKKPLSYILGYVEFAGIKFEVSPKTLIPRPETEYMIEAVNEHITLDTGSFNILDIGTGCGVLGLAVYYHNKTQVDALLLSELDNETLDVAKKNKQRLFPHDENISFLQANLLDHETIREFLAKEQTILVANLPYIPEELFETNTDETVKKREPKMAFVGGEDGCDLYRIMFDQLIKIRQGDNKTMKQGVLVMFLEMMTWQCDILRKEYPIMEFEEVKTFHFNIRILKTTIK